MRFQWLLLIACAAFTTTTEAATTSTQRRRRHSIIGTTNANQLQPPEVVTSPSDWSSSFAPELAIIRRVYDDCQEKNDFIGCLKQKALHALSRAIDQDSIKIVDGLLLEKNNQSGGGVGGGGSNQVVVEPSFVGLLTDARQFGNLAPIDRALLSKIDKLMRSHALKINMMDDEDSDDDAVVGRDKKKKKKKKDGGHIKYVIAALLTAMGIAGPLGLKALAAIAGKALVISKVALTIAGIIALKKLFSHDHSEETSFQVHAGDHNRRNTYVVRPVSKTNANGGGVTAAGANSSVDPYRYYYEYHQQ